MTVTDNIIDFLKGRKKGLTVEAPTGFCPNCWGRQEFGGEFYDAVQQHRFDLDKQDPEVGWIQDYVNKHLLPIELHPKEDKWVCNHCKTAYRHR